MVCERPPTRYHAKGRPKDPGAAYGRLKSCIFLTENVSDKSGKICSAYQRGITG